MTSDLGQHFDQRFYSTHAVGAFHSATLVLEKLFQWISPRRVIDVGCGEGAWLAAAEKLGAQVLKGLDGDWVDRRRLASPNIDFEAVQFEDTMPKTDGTYDLCISLEVAEHLSEARANAFVGLLCQSSPIVLFSAAARKQGGINHLNEQWQSYWAEIFRSHGFRCFDILRSQIWDEPSIPWWYRQNILLYVREDGNAAQVEELQKLEAPIIDVVHPQNYLEKVSRQDNPSLRFCLNCLQRYGARRVRRLFGAK